jgi:hypothetical protein
MEKTPTMPTQEELFKSGLLTQLIVTEETSQNFDQALVEMRAMLDSMRISEEADQQVLYSNLANLLGELGNMDDDDIIALLSQYGGRYLLPAAMHVEYQGDNPQSWPAMIRQVVIELSASN